MCDCFHVVLPSWPGAPGSVSGRQLQPEEPDAETEEDQSVTEGPVDEIIRPRPQGSSPVYEYAAEGASFGLPDTPSRRASSGSGGRRSWWKRDSGDSRTFSRMSRRQEATEVTLQTEVEAGASGYSVTGGGDQGIFVKQVLKDSSAAKLFSLREGDQLLSATIFFDNIKYEDALKILQYSEPYKVQFQIKRKHPAAEDEEGASSGAQLGPEGSEGQDKDVADGCRETPPQTLEGSGDRERLLAKPREGRGRRPQKERLSWPKFQSITSKRRPGPRRSHSSSEAYGRGGAPDVSPTSTDTEAQLPAEEQEQKAGPDDQRRRSFLNLRFRVRSGKAPTLEGRPGTAGQGGPLAASAVEEAGSHEGSQKASEATMDIRREDRSAEVPEGPLALPSQGALGEMASLASRPRRKTKEAKDQDDAVSEGRPGPGSAPRQGGEGHGIEIGIARSALQGKGDTQGRQPEFQIQIPTTLKTPRFKFAKERIQETEDATAVLGQVHGQAGTLAEKARFTEEGRQEPEAPAPGRPSAHLLEREGGAEGTEAAHGDGHQKEGEKDRDGKEDRTTLRFKIPSFGWSPRKDGKPAGEKPELELEGKGRSTITVSTLHTEERATRREAEERKPDTPGIHLTAGDLTSDGQGKQADLSLGDKGVAARDSKFKMPKFKMPSFGASTSSKDLGTSVDVSMPKIQAEVSVPSIEADVKTIDVTVELPPADLELTTPAAGLKLPEGQVPEGEPQEPSAAAGLKGHLPKVQMPSLKMPKVDIKAPQVDIEAPKLDLKGPKAEVRAPDVDVSLPSVEVDTQVPGAKLEADLSLGDKEVAARDSKFKMPKFKMPSFGASTPSKDLGTSVDVSVPKVGVEATLPSVGGEMRAPEAAVQLPTADVDLPGGELEVSLPEGEVSVSGLKGKAEGVKIKGQLPKVHMPSLKMPKVDLTAPQVDIKAPQVDIKAPQVDIKAPKLDLKGPKAEVRAPDVDVSLPSVEVDTQVPGAKLEADLSLGDKGVAARDSKFKMPKFKMPSFGASTPSKSLEASVDVSVPKIQAEVSVPSIEADVKTTDVTVELPPADLELTTPAAGLKLPEGQVPEGEPQEPSAAAGLKGHLPKVQMPSLKMPKVDIKAPQVDIKAPKLDLKGPKAEVSAPDVDVSLPSVEVDTQVPGAKLEADRSLGDKEVAARDSKFKMPKFKMPSFGASTPSKDLGTSVDVSVPKVGVEATLPSVGGEMRAPEAAVQLPTADVDLPGGELEVSLPEGEVSVSGLKGKAEGVKIKGQLPKVHMPSLKMPKVDLTAPQVDIKAPQVDIKAPQVDIKAPKLDLKGPKAEVRAPDVDVSLPSVEVDTQVPGAKLEADLSLGDKGVAARDSKFKMPKFKMPSFGASTPSKDLGTSVDVSVPKIQAEVSVPSIEADVKTTDVTVELPPTDLELTTPAVGLKLPEGQVPEGEPQEPSAAAGLKGHLPKVQMPSLKMPKVDIKAPQVDIKAPKLDLKGPKAEVRAPDVDVSLPSVEVDTQVPGAKLEADLSLGDKGVAARDSKFKMPKFKMPSFGASTPSKDLGTSVDVSVPKVGVEATLPSVGGEMRAPEAAVQLPTADVDLPGGELEVSLPEGEVSVSGLKGKAEGIKIKGQLPKVHMPSLKMPKVDLTAPQVDIKAPQVDIKAPQVDIKAPKLDLKGPKAEVRAPDVDVSLPSVEVDTQVPGAKLEADLSLGDKGVAARDSKFKMPKFKMPSFGASTPSKDLGTSVDVSVPKVGVEATLPSVGGEMRAPEAAVQLPTADVDLPGGELEVSLPEGEVSVSGLKGKAEGIKIKGQLPKVHMPSLKMPKVDLTAPQVDIKAPQVDIKAPQVDIKAPKLDLKGPKAEVRAPDVDVSLPSVEVDTQVPGAKLEADLSLGDKGVAARDSKFKMPKFKMPSFGASTPSKDLGTSVDVSVPKIQAEVSVPSIEADVKTTDVTVELPPADLELTTPAAGLKLPEGQVPEGEPQEPSAAAGLKGHLPKVQMPSLKMPKVDIKAPQVDIKAPKLDLKGPKAEVRAPDVDVSLPSVEVDTQVPGAKLEADLSLGDKGVAARDSKFKMPKFKMPSFGASTPSKDLGTSVDVSVPKVGVEATLPSVGGEMRAPEAAVQLPTADVDLPGGELEVSLPEGEVSVSGLKGKAEGVKIKGQLPKVHMPSLKMPKVDLTAPQVDIKAPQVDIKAPQVDIKAPKLDLKGPKAEVRAPDVDVSLPSVEVDTQVPGAKLEADLSLGDKGVAARDSKFKMPKFKMPSFGASTPSKSLEASVDVSVPKIQAEVSVPSIEADVKTTDVTVELPPADLELTTPAAGLKLPEGQVPEGEPQEPSAAAGLKGHLPKVQMPSLKMPKVDLTAPQVDIKAPQVDIKAPQVDIKAPKLDLKGPKAEVRAPDVDVSLPSVEVDTQVPGAKLEADLSLGDKGVAARDSKFKMPKFKMPSFGASTPSKDLGTSVDVSVPKVGVEATLPSVGGEMRAPEAAVQLPTADVDLPGGELEVSLPEGEVSVSGLKGKAEGVKIKGQLPKVHMPSLKMPKVDLTAPQVDIKAPQVDIKAPQVDIKAPKLDLKGPKAEVRAPDVDVSLPSVEVDTQVPGAKLEADLSLGDKGVAARDSKFKMPKFKMPSFGASTPSKDLGTSVDVSVPKIQAEVSVPSIEADVKTTDVTVELPPADLELTTPAVGLKLPEGQVPEGEPQEPSAAAGLKGHLPKVQMPSLKMPKVDIKAPQVDIKAPKLDLKGPKAEVRAPDVDVSLPSVEVDTQVPGAKLEADLSLGDKGVAARDSKFKMPKFKMPSFGASTPSKDLGTSVDVSVPKVGVEATLPSVGGEMRAPEAAVQLPTADVDLPGGELEVSLPEGEVSVSGLKGKAEGIKIKGQLPKVHMPSLKMPKVDLTAPQVDIKAPQVDIRAPQVDIKAPKLDLKGPKAEVRAPDVDVSLPSVEVDTQVPGAKLEADLSLGDKGVAARDSKFKMPKFKMPSFGASTPSKSLEASVDVSVPKIQAEVSVPSIEADVKTTDVTVELPPADLELTTPAAGLKLPEGQVPEGEPQEPSAAAGLKGHLPKVQMPSLKMPKVDIKAPQVDIKAPKLDLKGPKAEVRAPDVDVSLPSVEVDTQVPGAKLEADLSLGDKGVAARDSKFKMPKFKMPSFGASTPSKSLEASVDVSVPKIQAEVSVPSIEADVKTTDVTVELPPADLELTTPAAGLKLPEGQVPEGEPQEPSAAAGLKGHLPKVQMPSLKMLKVDIKAPQVDIEAPKLDLKGPKAEVSAPDVDVSLPSVEVDTQVPGAKLDADLSLGDKGVAARDSKFKMPKFKMPSFGASTPSKDLGTSVDVSVPKVGVEATLPSVGGEMRAPEAAVQLPTADVDLPGGELEVSLPEGEVSVSGLKGKAEGVKIKGQLPKVHMPSLKMPKVDLTAPQVDIKAPQVDIKAPQVDIKAPKLDLKGPKAEVRAPDVDVSLPSVEVDTQVPGAKLEADLSLGDKGVAARDSKFKMPKFKMPSFGASTPSKDLGTSVDVSVPKIQAEVSVPSIEADVKTTDVTVELPPADLELTTPAAGLKLPEGQVPEGEPQEPSAAAGLKGHLPKVQMPSLKMPKVDIKAPQVDIKAPKLDLKGPKAEVRAPDVDVSLPSVEVDTQVPGAKLEADLSLGDKGVAARDSKFKMPKFKMPSFGASTPSKSLEASVDVSVPKIQAEVSVPSIEADVKTTDVTVELPPADLELTTPAAGLKLPEGQVPEGEPQEPSAAAGLKGHLPKVQMPSLKMPKVDIKAPQVDIKAPKLDLKGPKAEVRAPDVDVSLPSVEVDTQVPGAKLEADLSLGDKGVAARDSKFKMPKFKMPSFGASTPSKDLGTSVDVSVPKVGVEATLPSVGGEMRAPEAAVQLPTADVDLPGGELEVSLPEGEVSVSGLKGKAEGVKIKGQLPKVHMPSLKMPKVDLTAPQVDIKAPQVDIKAPKLDLKGPKAEVSAPDVDVSLPSVEVDTRMPGAKLEADLSLGDKGISSSHRDQHSFHVESDISSSVGKIDEKSKSKKSLFKMPKVFSPTGKTAKSSITSARESEVESSSPASCDGVTLTNFQVTVPRGPISPELPCETPSVSQAASEPPSTAGDVDVTCSESLLLSQSEGPTAPVDTARTEALGRVTFPKFHRPKFQVSLPKSDPGGVEPGGAEFGSPTSPPLPVQGPDSSSTEATAFPKPGSQLPPAVVSAATAGTSAEPLVEAPGDSTERKGRGSPVKAPRLKLPSFSWSPKKGALSKADPGVSVVTDAGALGAPPGVRVPPAEAHVDVPLGKEGEAGGVRTHALVLQTVAPGVKASTGGAGLLPGDPDRAHTASGEGGIGGAGAATGPPEGADVNLHLPPPHVPSSDLRPSDATVEGSLSTGDLPVSKHGLSFGGSAKEAGLGDSSTSQLCGEGTAPSAEDPLLLSPTVGSPERAEAAGGAPVGSRESWFRMPSLRLPGFRRPTKERAGSAGPGAQSPTSAASAPGEGDAPAAVQGQDVRVPGSDVDAPKSPQPLEAGADGAAAGSPAPSYSDVLQRHLDLHAPAAGVLASEARVRPGAGSLPLQVHGAPAEPCAPRGDAGRPPVPGPAGQGPVRGAEGAEEPPSQPEGPLRLRASSTDLLSQVSVVNVGQVWEDSVLSVQFPTLTVPRFSFPAPGSEADVFVPSLRELPCPQSGPDTALHEQGPGVRAAGIPTAAEARGPPEAAPICKVRVHIQGAEAESRQVTVHSTVTAVYTELSGPEAFPTQIVRESEVPVSETQTPSYGFSLLKGRVPEAPARARVHVVTADSGPRGRLPETPEPVVPGADPVSGDLQPDTGEPLEPFEIISTSVDLSGPPECSSDLHSGLGPADSCSDEEPAEILEFPSEESQEAAAGLGGEGRAPRARPEGKRASGLFRFWLPSVGFSSSVAEASPDALVEAPSAAPVQTQPAARPPPSQEKGGWFRFPKLGFSSSPAKKSKSAEEEASPTEQTPQDEAGTFYDARESFSPEERGAGEQAPGSMVASAARTELILLEPDGAARQPSAPRPASK